MPCCSRSVGPSLKVIQFVEACARAGDFRDQLIPASLKRYN
jgi:hypothetical protein